MKDSEQKKKLILVSLAAVLFLIAAYLLFFRDAFRGPSADELEALRQNMPTEDEIRQVQPEALQPEREPPEPVVPGAGRQPFAG